ncbi:hypothetical protein WL30_21630 [Burkholderia ubonensis]|uniref:Uncharacterized protein n=1 Tax=Burkholderia ubonensis TaxID=101571 RepID=A0ABD4E664_9BURK|nr:hypothetical protein [Burkholderia ubonensis]KVN86150.1 hypothetical protein WJ68_11365 [Burkholderia ubonensis]KVO03594.1 hypothetical protein WJ69_26250 [Burkholderia ubonensis]KVZ64638.1 hypothetical protein WL19_25395 [Burkholderia ubonensis]KVZ79617.1 hypothetical protein WL24_20490 [Burkholderia ubonensis]KWA82290.1 hypothetical protein WL30_21630 [Burkholderia ubonensis]
MDDIKHPNDFPPLTIEQMRDLAVAVREEFGSGLSRPAFIERLLALLEDVPGFEAREAPTSLIESAWDEYFGRRAEI